MVNKYICTTRALSKIDSSLFEGISEKEYYYSKVLPKLQDTAGNMNARQYRSDIQQVWMQTATSDTKTRCPIGNYTTVVQ